MTHDELVAMLQDTVKAKSKEIDLKKEKTYRDRPYINSFEHGVDKGHLLMGNMVLDLLKIEEYQ